MHPGRTYQRGPCEHGLRVSTNPAMGGSLRSEPGGRKRARRARSRSRTIARDGSAFSFRAAHAAGLRTGDVSIDVPKRVRRSDHPVLERPEHAERLCGRRVGVAARPVPQGDSTRVSPNAATAGGALNAPLRLQGLIFCSTAAACVALTPQLRCSTPILNSSAWPPRSGARRAPWRARYGVRQDLYELRDFGWAFFGVVCFMPAVMVVGLWLWAPLIFLAGFLFVSLVHFSGDPKAGTPFIIRLLYGGAIIVLPSLLHAEDVSRIFSLLVGVAAAVTVTSALHAIAWPWLLATLLAASYRLPADRLSAAEIAAAALLATIAPPLIAFTVFFCLMHSARHVLRTFEYFAGVSPRLL